MGRTPSLKLTDGEVADMFGDPAWSAVFPPLLSVAQAAALAHVPVATIYDWSSRGLLINCARKRGKRLNIMRNRFVRFLLGE